MVARPHFPERIHRVADLVRIGQTAYVGRKHVHEIRNDQIVFDRVPLANVLEIHFIEKFLQVFRALLCIIADGGGWHAAPRKIAAEGLGLVSQPRHRKPFGKRQRPDMHLLPTVSEVCGDVA